MEYIRVTRVDDPWFTKLHQLMQEVFPAEEVLAAERWAEPLLDPTIRVCVAALGDEVVGATEYRYLPDLQVAMTDFTIIARTGLGVGRYLWQQRERDLRQMAQEAGKPAIGMFAEVYNPQRVEHLTFGNHAAMHPVVRREVLSHMGYQRLDFPYVHPSWQDDGAPVGGLDFCFLPYTDMEGLPGEFVARFLGTYYAVLPNKPEAWVRMVEDLKQTALVPLRPL